MKNFIPHLLLLINQTRMNNENSLFSNLGKASTLGQINKDMFTYLKLFKNQVDEIKKTNARYMARVEDVLVYESGDEKNENLMIAWDGWAKSLEKKLTKKQYCQFLLLNHDALWELQMNQV